jgi:methyl-accepting chemotaxis protein
VSTAATASLARLSVRDTDAAQLLVDFLNGANAVSRYAVAVGHATMPVLVTPPDGYADFVDALATAKLHALRWTDEVLPTFSALPASIINLNTIIQPKLDAVQAGLNALQTNPDDKSARSAVTSSISSLQQDDSPCAAAITDLQTWITDYQSLIAPDAQTLSSIVTKLTSALDADEGEIDKLKGVVANLQSIIDDRNELVVLDRAGNATFSIFLGVVGAAVGAPFSGVAALVVGVLVGVSTGAFTAFVPVVDPPDYKESMDTLQSTMDDVNTEIGLVNTIVGLLQTTSDQLAALVAQSSTVAASASEVLAFWKQVQDDQNSMAGDVERVLGDVVASGNIADALTAVSQAQQSWASLETMMNSISTVSYTVSDTVDLPSNAVNPYSTAEG